jgi:YidC/Oxa1 family membrane protein insertase
MDTKRLILSITLTLAMVIGYRLFIQHELALHPSWAATQPADTTTANPSVAATTAPTTNVIANIYAPSGLAAVGTTQPISADIGKDAAIFPMVMSIDPRGAGLISVTLSDYHQTAAPKSPLYEFEQPVPGFESETRPLATRTVTVDGTDIDVSNVIWSQVVADRSSVTYAATIVEVGQPVLELTKQFTLLPRDAKDKSGGYDVAVHQGFRSLTAKPMKVSAVLNGPTPPARENDLSEDRRYVGGYDNGDKTLDTASTLVSELKKDKPAKDLTVNDSRPLLWIGACNSYFESIIRPDSGQPIKLASVIAAPLDTGSATAATDFPTTLTVYTSDFTLAPGALIPLDMHVYFGPKIRHLLQGSYYAAFPLWYDQTLVYSSGPCGYITFSWLITVLSGILTFFHLIFRDWGLAIIGLVCLVRLLLHPITKKSQINMMQMSKMGPEIERLKKKYGDNKDELNKAMMGVYKQQGLTPVLGCLPMFLQTPIWIALWSALQSTFELRQAGFLRHGGINLTWIKDLSHPDALITFAQPLSLFGFFHVSSLNILPLLLAVVFFIQQSMQPMPANMTPEQEQQRKMMKWMSLLFPVMLYGRPSGLSLYILTSTTIGIIENKIIRDHIKQREEAEKSGKIIVGAPPTRNSKRNKDDKQKLIGGPKSAGTKPGGIAGFLAGLQEKAEEIRREAERRSKDRA